MSHALLAGIGVAVALLALNGHAPAETLACRSTDGNLTCVEAVRAGWPGIQEPWRCTDENGAPSWESGASVGPSAMLIGRDRLHASNDWLSPDRD